MTSDLGAAAQAWERDKFAEKDHGAWVTQAGGRIKLRDFATQWLEDAIDLAPPTRRIYADDLRLHILPKLGNVPLGAITPELCERWLVGLRRTEGRRGPLAAASIHQPYRDPAPGAGGRDQSAAHRPQPPRPGRPAETPQQEMRFLNHDEVACLADAVGDRYRAFVLMAAYCGARAGELRELRRRDVDLVHNRLTRTQQLVSVAGGGVALRPLKTRRSRRSPAGAPHVADALEVHLSTCGWAQPGPDGLVFTSPEGEVLHLDNFRLRVWQPACEHADVAPLRIHDVRHTCASLAIAAGADVLVLQRMLGHASAAMTLDRYGHLIPGQAETIAQQLSAPRPAAHCHACGEPRLP